MRHPAGRLDPPWLAARPGQPFVPSHDPMRSILLAAKLVESGHRWTPFLTRRSLSCGIYQIPEGGTDGPSPRARDGMAAGPRPTGQTPYDEGSERGRARVSHWFGDSSAAQLEIVYGRPDWKPAYDSFLTEPSGMRWRFGENFWTTLDTNIPMTIDGVELDVGQHYLVLQNLPEHGLHIFALDPQQVRRRRLDAYEANETKGSIAIPLTHDVVEATETRLTIDLSVDRSQADQAGLTIRFGPHLLTAPVVMRR